MHYTIKYNQPTMDARLQAARNDAAEYLGHNVYRKIMDIAITDTTVTYKQFAAALSVFAGLEGLPVRAMWSEIVRCRIS